MEAKPDFAGWATKNDLECTDGRIIRGGAFQHQDSTAVPLVWQHGHNDPSNILGKAILHHRDEGVYTEGYFNTSESAIAAKNAVQHGDINALSIYANKLKQNKHDVIHGNIVEVSLVIAGANPGACIETVSMAHSSECDALESGIIYTGEDLYHGDFDEDDVLEHFGVKGMKWGVRKDKGSGAASITSSKGHTVEYRQSDSKTNRLMKLNRRLGYQIEDISMGSLYVNGKHVGETKFAETKDSINTETLAPALFTAKTLRGKGPSIDAAIDANVSLLKHMAQDRGKTVTSHLNLSKKDITPEQKSVLDEYGFKLGREVSGVSMANTPLTQTEIVYDPKDHVKHSDSTPNTSPLRSIFMKDAIDTLKDMRKRGATDKDFKKIGIPNFEEYMSDLESLISKTNGKESPDMEHQDTDESLEHGADQSLEDVISSMNDDQQQALYYLVNRALEEGPTKKNVKHSDDNAEEESLEHTTLQEEKVDRNTFETFGANAESANKPTDTLSHDALNALVAGARDASTTSLQSFMASQNSDIAHSIAGMDLLFPEAKALQKEPMLWTREMAWVDSLLGGLHKTPMGAVKALFTDTHLESARALGYEKGTKKHDEVVKILGRSTRPTTVYKKQTLDRDDIIDITDFDIVRYLDREMNIMLKAEIARAVLFGDGRQATDPNKIKDPSGIEGAGIRSVLHDDELYTVKYHSENLRRPNVTPATIFRDINQARALWKGTGSPTMYVTPGFLVHLKSVVADAHGTPVMGSEAKIREFFNLAAIVEVDAGIPTLTDNIEDEQFLFILMNPSDYVLGTPKGGEITRFEDFDIDFNQKKMLIETRLSGGLVKPHSAVVVTGHGSMHAADPATVRPTYNDGTHILTMPAGPGIVFKLDGGRITLNGGGTYTLSKGEVVRIDFESPANADRLPVDNTIDLKKFVFFCEYGKGVTDGEI